MVHDVTERIAMLLAKIFCAYALRCRTDRKYDILIPTEH